MPLRIDYDRLIDSLLLLNCANRDSYFQTTNLGEKLNKAFTIFYFNTKLCNISNRNQLESINLRFIENLSNVLFSRPFTPPALDFRCWTWEFLEIINVWQEIWWSSIYHCFWCCANFTFEGKFTIYEQSLIPYTSSSFIFYEVFEICKATLSFFCKPCKL